MKKYSIQKIADRFGELVAGGLTSAKAINQALAQEFPGATQEQFIQAAKIHIADFEAQTKESLAGLAEKMRGAENPSTVNPRG